jgi:hypothetical protein
LVYSRGATHPLCGWRSSLAKASPPNLLGLLLAQTRVSVCDTDVELLGALHDDLAVLGGHVVRNLGAVSAVVHEEKVQVGHVGHQELLEAVGEVVLPQVVGTITDLGLENLSPEATAHARINTLALAPLLVVVQTNETLRLVPDEFLGHLLGLLALNDRTDGTHVDYCNRRNSICMERSVVVA